MPLYKKQHQFTKLQRVRCAVLTPVPSCCIMADGNDDHSNEGAAPVDGSTLDDLEAAIFDALDSSGALGELKRYLALR
jgi:hypothetical protein